jgi:hypothetical protein
MKGLIIILHVFSQTGQPLPSSSSKGKDRKGSEGPLSMSAQPQRWKHPAEQPIVHQSLQLPPLCGVHGQVQQQLPAKSMWTRLLSEGYGEGVWLLFWKNLKCQSVPCMLTSWQGTNSWACSCTKPQMWKLAWVPFPSGQNPSTLPWLHASKCQDATDWIDAEDFPFLWFFCLFWVYTIIKKSLVLAGNFKNKTKQNKETTLPWLIAAELWPG